MIANQSHTEMKNHNKVHAIPVEIHLPSADIGLTMYTYIMCCHKPVVQIEFIYVPPLLLFETLGGLLRLCGGVDMFCMYKWPLSATKIDV